MIRIDCIWLALGASDLRGGIDKLLAQVVHGFALGAQAADSIFQTGEVAPFFQLLNSSLQASTGVG